LLDARGVEVVPAVHSTHVLAISIVLLQKPRYMYSVKNQVILIKNHITMVSSYGPKGLQDSQIVTCIIRLIAAQSNYRSLSFYNYQTGLRFFQIILCT
jgi:hypothetical protein